MVGSVIAASAEDRRLQDNGEGGVSVIVPMYNAATTIERSLASVCEQTYKNLEIIVVDDGSRDASAEIVRKWEKADSRVRLYRQANAGVAAARNAGFAQSNKCLVAFIDADDLWAPDKVRAQVEVLRENSGPALVYCWFVEINELDQVTSVKPEGHVGNVGAHSGVKHMAQMVRWLAVRATASGHHGAAASHLVRLGKVDPLAAARGICRFGRDSLLCMTGAGRKPLSTTRYQDILW